MNALALVQAENGQPVLGQRRFSCGGWKNIVVQEAIDFRRFGISRQGGRDGHYQILLREQM